MMRTLCVWLPTFATDVVRRRLIRLRHAITPHPASGTPGSRGSPAAQAHHVPILLTRPVAQRDIVERCCALALRQGVRPGMDLAQARPLLPARTPPHVEASAPARTAAALHALACWALRVSPLVAPEGEDGLVIDLTGTQWVHADEAALLRRLSGHLSRMGFASRCAIASTHACAWGVARWAPTRLTLVPAGQERAALAGLPASALAIDDATAQRLAEVGVQTVAQVLALPRPGLVARYGAGLALRIDEALGRTLRPLSFTPVTPSPPPCASMLFDGPTDHPESVMQAARIVLERLSRQLAHAQRGVRRLHVRVHRPRAGPSDPRSTDVEVTLSRASSNPAHLWKLLRAALERVDLAPGVEGITMTAVRTARQRHQQAGITGGDERAQTIEAALGELIDTLAGRLGQSRVLHADALASHLPERAWTCTPVLEERVRPPPASAAQVLSGAPRPTLLYPRAEPARVVALTPDGPVLRVHWRGEEHRVVHCDPPERIAPEWWRDADTQQPPERVYTAAQTEHGRWLFLCGHAGTGAWFVHGEWA